MAARHLAARANGSEQTQSRGARDVRPKCGMSPCTVKLPAQPTCICFNSSRLWVSSSRTRFCSINLRKLLRQLKFSVQLGGRVSSYPDVELLRFYHPLLQHRAVELQFIAAELEVNRLLRSWRKCHSLKPF